MHILGLKEHMTRGTLLEVIDQLPKGDHGRNELVELQGRSFALMMAPQEGRERSVVGDRQSWIHEKLSREERTKIEK
jgi:hypothetical protein